VPTATTDEVLPGLGILRHENGDIGAYLPDADSRCPHHWAGTFDNREDAIAYLEYIAKRSAR
jgi:hypothetical protein